MVLILHCDNFDIKNFPRNVNTDICTITEVKWKLTACLCVFLLVIGIYLLQKWKFRSHITLLTFHNLRAFYSLALLAINTLELARAFIYWTSSPLKNATFMKQNAQNDSVVIVIGTATLCNAFAAIFFTAILVWFHRVVELKKTVVYLYVSLTAEAIVFGVRIYELAEIVYDQEIYELEPCLQSFSALCLLLLSITDGFSIYKERYQLDYLEDYEKIGYKHTLATFYSKACFWWLTPLLWLGYKDPLELEDLGQMRLEDSARAHYDRFLLIYKTSKAKNDDKPPSLWLCYVKSYWRMFTLGGVLKLFGDLFSLVGPLAIQYIVKYIESMYLSHFSTHPNTTINATQILNENKSKVPLQIDDHGIMDDRNYGIDVKFYYSTWIDLISNGWAIAWIVLLAALTQGALSQASTHVLNMTGIGIKTSLQGLIYRKTLLLTSSSIHKSNSDEVKKVPESAKGESDEVEKEKTGVSDKGLNDVGAITNFMSEDTLNIMSFFWIAHYVWAIPLKIGIVMYLLYLKLGISAIIGSFICIAIMTPLQFLIGKKMSTNTEIMAKFTDDRLKKVHDTLLGIKLIKLNAWDDVFMRKILGTRGKELKYLAKDSLYWTLMTMLTHISSVLIAFVTLAFYVYLQSDDSVAAGISADFNASQLFSALALFQQLTVPLLIFPITVPIILSAIVSTKRLEDFLSAREIQKQFEGIRNMARILCKSDASLDMYEIKLEAASPALGESNKIGEENEQNQSVDKRLTITNISAAPLAQTESISSLNNALELHSDDKQQKLGDNCECPKECMVKCIEMRENLIVHRKELLRNTAYVSPRQRRTAYANSALAKKCDSLHRDSLILKMPSDMVVCVRDGSFTWNPQDSSIDLKIRYITIPKGRLTMIVGKNGSGKSSLLSALLMEMPQLSGDVIWNKTSTVAFVPQQPWLLNASIRDNILFGESFRPKRYDFVLEACALKPDIGLMPQADLTLIGERGVNLSGGQCQRVAIARALYSSANVVIMDDPLSSLDNEVAVHIFKQSIKKMLLKSNRTVILVSQQLHLVKQANYLIVMKDGRLEATGSYKDIEVVYPHITDKWNSIITMMQEFEKNQSSDAGRTIRERRKLCKNIVKLGLQRSISVSSAASGSTSTAIEGDANSPEEIIEEMAENYDFLPSLFSQRSSFYGSQSGSNFARNRSSVYGSRHLFYDAPLPIDECQTEDVVMRRRKSRRPASLRASTQSRLSGISTSSAEMRRSLHTTSCSSGTSYASNQSNNSNASTTTTAEANEIITQQIQQLTQQQQPRVKSWQPQSVTTTHKPVARNISSPDSFLSNEGQQTKSSDATIVADLVNSTKSHGGFHQFLSRMSMRRSNKGTSGSAYRLHHRPVSTTKSILSISEENLAATSSTTDKSSVTTVAEEENWLDTIEDEESIIDSAGDALLPNASANDAERKYGKIPLKIYMIYLKASGVPVLLIFFLTALIWQSLRVYTDMWLQHWTDDNGVLTTNVTNSKTLSAVQHDISYYFRIYTLISTICILMAMISVPAGQWAGCNARRNLHDNFLQTIMRKSIYFFQVTPLGRLMNRFSNDIAVIDKKIAATSQRLLQFTLLCLCAVLINIIITPWFFLVTLPICISYYAIQRFYRSSSRELQRIENSTHSPIISHLSETIQGVTTIRAYNQESRFTEILFKRLEANTIAFTILNTSNRWLGISLDYLGGIIVFVAIVTALTAATIACTESKNITNYNKNILQDISPSPSLVGLAINYTLLVPIYLNWVVKLLADMEMYVGSVERIAHYAEKETSMETNTEHSQDTGDNNIDDEPNKVTSNEILNKDSVTTNAFDKLVKTNKAFGVQVHRNYAGRKESLKRFTKNKHFKAVPISWPHKGDIFFDNVSLRYEGQTENVINNLTLQIPAGQRLGICGRTGSGKSSLALSLFGVLQTTGGRILIDDVDIVQIHPDETRTRLSIIPQDVHLFNATVRENLDPPGYYSDLAVWNCLELAQLKDFVNNQLPQGLDTELGDNGIKLSAGYRQLFCLARAILRGSVCLILDEATSFLDSTTEKALLAAANKAFAGKTILTIAHRLSTILDYDRIIVMEKSKIIEDGTPQELQNKPNGIFRSLLNSGRPLSGISDSGIM